jgi:LysM repeat protein
MPDPKGQAETVRVEEPARQGGASDRSPADAAPVGLRALAGGNRRAASPEVARYVGTAAGNRRLGRALLARRDLLSGTGAPTERQHADVEAVLHPGSRVVVSRPARRSSPPVVTVVGPPAMTGGGPGGAFEVAMLAALRTAVQGWANVLRTRRAAGPPVFPMAQANDVATAAQEEVERHFDPWIQGATREAADLYHPGTFNLAAVLGNQSARVLDDGQRMGWTQYWMTLDGVGQQVLDSFNVLQDRDTAEFDRVLQLYALDPANRTDIDDAIHSWPAEAGTATVFIQPYADPAADMRTVRWDLFTTLLHEMMHKVAHPNFERAAQAVGGTAQKYMTEGFADLMRHDLWDGPAGLRARLATRAAAPLRRRVEGATFPYDASKVVYHPDYTEIAQARAISRVVGMQNCKAAFFLGHTELLGIGAGTGATTPLAGISEWATSDATDSQMYIAQPGDTVASISARTGVPVRSLRRENPRDLPGSAEPTAGMRIAALGIRYVRAIRGDTLGTVARQNGVTVAALAAANGFPAAAPDATALAAGRRMLIPRRP